MKYVIIGSGVAGIAALEAIRSVDQSGEIILVGDDPHGYYSRPGLAYYLSGEIPNQALFSKQPEDFQKLHIRLLKGRVKRIFRGEQYIEVEGQRYVPYDRLLLALGALSTPLEVPGSKFDGVVKLDHLSDAHWIIKQAKRGRTAIVVGGGITALELVEGLIAQGMKVHYLLRGDRYWSSVLDYQESKIVEQRLKLEGVKLHYHSEIGEITEKHNHIHSIRLMDGTIMRCDLLAYAIGVQPQIHLAKQAGLETDRGILVNEYLQTSDLNIYAAGDVAQVYDPFSKRSVIESLWNPAREQGSAAGLNMAGRRKVYIKSAPFNVTRLAGLTITIIGRVGRGQDQDLLGIARGDSETWRQVPDTIVAQTGFEVNRLRIMVGRHTLIGAVIMGDQTLSPALEKIISNKVNISSIRDGLLSPNANISDVIAGFWSNFRERGLNVHQKTIPRNLQLAFTNSSLAGANSQQTIPRSIKLGSRGSS